MSGPRGGVTAVELEAVAEWIERAGPRTVAAWQTTRRTEHAPQVQRASLADKLLRDFETAWRSALTPHHIAPKQRARTSAGVIEAHALVRRDVAAAIRSADPERMPALMAEAIRGRIVKR